jgi:hypothetical protein
MPICSIAMEAPQASHVSPLPGLPKTRGTLIARKTPVLELVRDDDVESFVVHGGALSGVAI